MHKACFSILAVLVLAASATSAAAVELAQSARLGITITAADVAWCRERPAFIVDAADANTFTTPAFGTAVARFGGAVVLPACAEAKAAELIGRVAGQEVWHGVAEATRGWTLQAAATSVALDLDTAAVPIPAAAPLAGADRASAEAALASVAGRAVSARHCWAAGLHDQNGITQGCLRVRSATAVGSGMSRRAYLLLASDNATDQCHACSGLALMAVLAPSAPGWRVVASSGVLHSGSFGLATPSKDFTFVRLGRDRWGWKEYAGYEAQGELSSGTVIFAPRGGTIPTIGTVPGDHGNIGACLDGLQLPSGEDCMDVHISLHIDDSDLARPAYPIILAISGTRRGKAFAAARATATYSEETGTYAVPTGLP